MQAACRLCGFPVRGFLSGTTCVLQVDGRVLRVSCHRPAGAEDQACAGLQDAVRAARRP